MSATEQAPTAAENVAALRARMQQFRDGDLAKASGLSRSNIRLIKSGNTSNPGVITVEKLTAAVIKLEAEPKRKRPTRRQKSDGKAATDA